MATLQFTSKPKRGRPSAERVNKLIEEGNCTTSKTQCMICKRVFPREKSLNTHMKSHNGEKPYVCTFPHPNQCGKRFVQSGQLRTHERTHTDEKCFICPLEGCGQTHRHVNRKCPIHSHLHLIRCEDKEYIPNFMEKYKLYPEVIAWFEDHLQKDNKRKKNKNSQEKDHHENSLNSTQELSYVSTVDSSSVLDYSSYAQNSLNNTNPNGTVDSISSLHEQIQNQMMVAYEESAHNSSHRNYNEPNYANVAHVENLSTLNTSDIMSSPIVKNTASCLTPTTSNNTNQNSFYSTPIGNFKSPRFLNSHNAPVPYFLTPIGKPRASANLFPPSQEKDNVSTSTPQNKLREFMTIHEPNQLNIKSRRALLSDLEAPKFQYSARSLSNASSQSDLREKKLSYHQMPHSKSFTALPCKSPNIAQQDRRYKMKNHFTSNYNYSQTYGVKNNDCHVPTSNAYRNEMSNYNLLDGIKPLELPVATHSVNQGTTYDPNQEFKFTLRRSNSRDSDNGSSTNEINNCFSISMSNEKMPPQKTLPTYSESYPHAINDAYSKYEERVRNLSSEDSALQMMLTENRNNDQHVEVLLSEEVQTIKEEYSPVREHDYAAKSTSQPPVIAENVVQNKPQPPILKTKGSKKYFDPQTEEKMRNQLLKDNTNISHPEQIYSNSIKRSSPHLDIMNDQVADREAALVLSAFASNSHLEARAVNSFKTEPVVTPEISPASVDSAYKSQCTASDEENINQYAESYFEARTPYKGHVGPVRGSHDFRISNNGFSISCTSPAPRTQMNSGEQHVNIPDTRLKLPTSPVNYRSPIRKSPRKTPRKNYFSPTKIRKSPSKSSLTKPKKFWLMKSQGILSPVKTGSGDIRANRNCDSQPLRECSNILPSRRLSYDKIGLLTNCNAENEDQPLNLSLH